MTLICFDGKTLATDSLHSTEDGTVAYHASKIVIVKQKAVATAGCTTHQELFEDWIDDGMRADQYPGEKFDDDFTGVILDQNGKLTVYLGKLPNPEKIVRRSAFGHSPAISYALALIDHAGMNAVAAVEHTCAYSTVCDKPVYSITKDVLKKIRSDYRGLWTGTLPDDAYMAQVKRR